MINNDWFVRFETDAQNIRTNLESIRQRLATVENAPAAVEQCVNETEAAFKDITSLSPTADVLRPLEWPFLGRQAYLNKLQTSSELAQLLKEANQIRDQLNVLREKQKQNANMRSAFDKIIEQCESLHRQVSQTANSASTPPALQSAKNELEVRYLSKRKCKQVPRQSTINCRS
jgi:DNA repair ATPase RecN